jgi:putative ABC transport system substrate-binding protein
MIGRREVIALAGATTLASSLPAGAQPAVPVVGYLSSATSDGFAHFVAAFRRGLGETGHVEGRNIVIEFRWADGDHGKLPQHAADFVRRKVAVIAATGGSQPALAAKAATSTIPIVFSGGGDPVKLGLVASLGRPGGNATGVLNIGSELIPKRLEILRELVPAASTIAVLANPTSQQSDRDLEVIARASPVLGVSYRRFNAATEADFEPAFAAMARQGVGALLVVGEPYYMSRRTQLVAMAARYRIPAAYGFRDFCLVGGLMSYGTNLVDLHRQVGVYVGRILNGAKPADLPVTQPTKFDLVINLRTAKALGLAVPTTVLGRADDVIE